MVMFFVLLVSSTVVAQGALSGILSPALRDRGGLQSGAENESCTAVDAPVEFEVFAFLELRGQPGLVTEKDLAKLQDTLVDSYNSVIMCNQPGAFKVIDEAKILPNALADNFLSPLPAGVDFTYVVVSVNSWWFAVLQSITSANNFSFFLFRRFEDGAMPVQMEFVSLVLIKLLCRRLSAESYRLMIMA